jgi:Protein of unknown function (DUF3570)
VAATDRPVPMPGPDRRRTRPALREFPWVVAGLGALASRDVLGQSSVDTKFLFYKESDGRTQVVNPMVLLHQDLGDQWGNLDLLLTYDAISGASPSGAYPTADATTSASGKTGTTGNIPQTTYKDTRKSIGLTYGKKFGAHLPSIDVSYANENDYTARSVGLSDAWTMAGGRGTLHFGVSLARDFVDPVTNNLHFNKNTNGFALGWTWILGERDLIDVSGSLMQQSGYLDDPYKVVPIGLIGTAVTAPDHRPDTRSRWALVTKYAHYYPWDGAIKASYRYYRDDWSVQAHTLDVTYDQKLDSDWIISPRVRLYTQTAASFYGQLFSSPETYMSADYRLSALSSILGGLGFTKKIDEQLAVNFAATYQSQTGRDRVTPIASTPAARGAGTVSAADMTIYTVTVGFTWKY